MVGDHKKIDKTLSEEFTPSAFNIKPDGSNASSAVEGGFQFTSKGKKDSSSLLLFSGHATIATTSTTTLLCYCIVSNRKRTPAYHVT